MTNSDFLRIVATANRMTGYVEIANQLDDRADAIEEVSSHQPGYCEIGMSRCFCCGWQGEYPVSGCPNCNRSFVE